MAEELTAKPILKKLAVKETGEECKNSDKRNTLPFTIQQNGSTQAKMKATNRLRRKKGILRYKSGRAKSKKRRFKEHLQKEEKAQTILHGII